MAIIILCLHGIDGKTVKRNEAIAYCLVNVFMAIRQDFISLNGAASNGEDSAFRGHFMDAYVFLRLIGVIRLADGRMDFRLTFYDNFKAI